MKTKQVYGPVNTTADLIRHHERELARFEALLRQGTSLRALYASWLRRRDHTKGVLESLRMTQAIQDAVNT